MEEQKVHQVHLVRPSEPNSPLEVPEEIVWWTNTQGRWDRKHHSKRTGKLRAVAEVKERSKPAREDYVKILASKHRKLTKWALCLRKGSLGDGWPAEPQPPARRQLLAWLGKEAWGAERSGSQEWVVNTWLRKAKAKTDLFLLKWCMVEEEVWGICEKKHPSLVLPPLGVMMLSDPLGTERAQIRPTSLLKFALYFYVFTFL